MGSRMDQEITWCDLELTELLEEEDAHVYFEKITKHLALHPYHLNNIRRGLNQILRSSLNTYDRELKGFTLAFRNPKLLSHLGELFYDSPFIHIDIEADFYLFRPTVGSFLKGIVNKKGLDHIVVLIHKIYTISIPKPDNMEEWIGDTVEIGQEVRCCVTEIDNRSKPPFICATLKSDYLQGCRLLENTNDIDNMDSTIKSQNVNNSMKIGNSTNGVSEDDIISDKEKIKHWKKHKKSRKTSTGSAFEDGIQVDSSNNTENHIYRNIKNNTDSMNSDVKSYNPNNTIKIENSISEVSEDVISDKDRIKHRKKHKKSRQTDTESAYEDGTQVESSNNTGNDIYRNIKREGSIDSKNSVIKKYSLNNTIKMESSTNRVSEDDAISDKERIKHRKKRKRTRETDTESTFKDEIETEWNNNTGNDVYTNIKCEDNIDNTNSAFENHDLNSIVKIENSFSGVSEDDIISDKERIKRRKKHKKSRDTESVLTDENEATSSFDYPKDYKKSKKTRTMSDSESKSHVKIKVEKSDSDLELEHPIKIKVEHI